MTANDKKPDFLDRGTILAIGIMLVFWFGWSKFMEIKYPQPTAPVVNAAGNSTANSGAGSGLAAKESATGEKANLAADTAQAGGKMTANSDGAAPAADGHIEEHLIVYESENLGFALSSKGMGLRDIDIKKYKTRTDGKIVLGGVQGDYPFATHLNGSDQAVDFVVEHPQPDLFIGRSSIDGFQIEKTVKVDASQYAVDISLRVTGNLEKFKGLSTSMSEVIQVPEAGGVFGSSSREFQDWFLRHDGKKTRQVIQAKDGVQLAEANITLAALSTHYFTLAVVDKSDLLPRFEAKTAAGSATAVGRMIYQPVSHVDHFDIHYIGYAGPKSFEGLARVDESLSQVVDYGMFGFLGQPILWLLKFLFSLVGNWGVAIILLTIIVRTIVLPFNAYSFKSMKAMQRIQPEMARIRERYKDKPNDQKLQMNKEIMDLMKQNKASPLGGCLPTLLQLPPFFALYQVLGQSIELYRAPFIFWIHDLSARDPFFVLPVLMGATMFAQQKLTPTAMDPQQAKIMMWMPLIFSVFMISLPSGLTLYIFISTLFGITQQYFFMRDKATLQNRVKEAKA